MKGSPKMKVYNEIFEHRLKPCAFRVYLYLSGTFCKRGSKGRVKIETIALRCNMSVSNIKRALEELQHKKLIQKCECWGYIPSNGKQLRRRLANEYIIKPLSGGFFMLDKRFLMSCRDNYALMVYCALLRHANKHGMSFPSISRIAEETGLSRTTVIRKVSILKQGGYINKRRYVRKCGCYGNNNHTVLGFKERIVSLLIKAAQLIASFFNFKSSGNIAMPIALENKIRVEVCPNFASVFLCSFLRLPRSRSP